MNNLLDETIGWIGAGLILLAYALVSFNSISSSQIIYHALNGLGAIGIVYISLKKRAYPPGVLNIIWLLIAIIAILLIIL